jgi:hypothetical protein
MPGKDRQQTSESSTKASIASCGDADDSVVPAHLIELGQQALAEVTANVARGEPLVRCQLLASEFYEALKRELRPMSHLGVVERAMVVAAANQCRHAATAGISPGAMLGELRTAIALLRFSGLIPPAAAHIEKLRSAGPVVEVRFPIVGKVWTTTTQDLADRILKDSETFTLRRDDGSVAGSSGAGRPAHVRQQYAVDGRAGSQKVAGYCRRGLPPPGRPRNGAKAGKG